MFPAKTRTAIVTVTLPPSITMSSETATAQTTLTRNMLYRLEASCFRHEGHQLTRIERTVEGIPDRACTCPRRPKRLGYRAAYSDRSTDNTALQGRKTAPLTCCHMQST
jgi:hypothetical protein